MLAANILREYGVRNSKNYFQTDQGSRYGVPAANVMGLFILEKLVIDTAFTAPASNRYATDLMRFLRGSEDSNKIRLKLGLISLVHFPILRIDQTLHLIFLKFDTKYWSKKVHSSQNWQDHHYLTILSLVSTRIWKTMSMLYLGQPDVESLTARSDALNNTMIMISALFLRMSENLSIINIIFQIIQTTSELFHRSSISRDWALHLSLPREGKLTKI